MKRRQFITLIGGAVASWPLAARGQQAAIPVIGWIDTGARAQFADRVAGFMRGLAENGFVDGQNIRIEDRWAEGQYDRLPAMAADLVQRRVAVLVATGAVNATKAAIDATKAIPVVFANGGDPVKLGLVGSLNRPGANATGVSFFIGGLGAKRVELARTLAPEADNIAVLANPNNPVAAPELADIQAAGSSLGLNIVVLNAGNDAEIDAGFAVLAQKQIRVLLVNTDSFLSSRRARIAEKAAAQKIPAIYAQREFPLAGGLISYGTNLADGYRQAGVYAGRILHGAKPADLPIVLPTRFEMVINLKTAAALGLTIPPSLLGLADEVIE
jgi:putative ABC transport system substrate-binding protein